MADLLISVPPNELPSIEAIYVIVSVDDNGNEGVCGVDGVPAVFANPRLLSTVMNMLRTQLRNVPGRRLRVLKFSTRTVVEALPYGA